MDLGPASVSPEPMTAILTAPTRIKLTGLKRPAPVADEENGLSQLEAHSTAHAAAEILPSTAAGDATPGAAHPPKRIRPTREGVRRGKWTTEEQKYADRLISDFEAGLLPLENGATLRAFLSKKLNCDPMRISKKFAGAKCLGKQIFLKKSTDGAEDGMVVDGVAVSAPVMTAETMQQREEELQRLEADFLKSITAIANGSNSRRRNRNSAAKKKAAAAAAAAAASVPHDDELERDVLAHTDGFGFEMSTFAGLISKSASSAVPMHDSFGAISSSSESDDLEDQGLTSHDDNSDSDDNTDGIALPDYMVMPKLELGNSSEEELCYQGQDANGMPRLCYDSDTDSPADIQEAMDSLASMPMSALGSDSRRGFGSMGSIGPMGDDLSTTLNFLAGDDSEHLRHVRGSHSDLIEPLADFLPDECFMMEPL